MSTGYFPKSNRTALYLDNLHHGIITASHILHKHGIFDAYGHISVRNPDNEKTFLMPCNMPPALLSDASEIVEYQIVDGEPVEGDKAKPGYLERYIHRFVLTVV
jgi:ribulose-5-phosphate 4-epimerase/fuculose-1-phosphate aldolase